MPGKKRPNKKEEFNKSDEFDFCTTRGVVHTFYQNKKPFSLRKLPNKQRDEVIFPCSTTMLSILLKELGFRHKKRQGKSIIHERPDLVSWREAFLRKIKEIRETEPHREIVCTDENWLHSGHT